MRTAEKIAWPTVAIVIFCAGLAIATGYGPSDNWGAAWGKTRARCDRAVADLLHSTELIEVERAGFIVQRLECGIGRRL